MTPSNHELALKYYKEHQEELVKKYNGKTIIFNNADILEVKNSFQEAYDFAVKEYGIGNFSLQEIAPGVSSYTAYIASPGIIA